MPINQTAILIFARTANEELSAKKLFGNNQAKNAQLLVRLNKKVRQTAEKTALPSYVLTAKKQVGHNFVSRYKNAIASIFDKGFSNVIVVGNDSPELTSSAIKEIDFRLKENNLVYGATNKGGIYALGLTREGFENFDFLAMPWQTELLTSQFDLLKHESVDVYRLKSSLIEFNTSNDVSAFLDRLNSNFKDRIIFGFLFQLSFANKLIFSRKSELKKLVFRAFTSLRGPPNCIQHSS